MIIIALQFSLTAILAVAAVGKLRDLPGSRHAVHDFGVPERVADPLGTILPIVELGLALMLIHGATARWAALGAMILFLAFIAGIAANLMRGRQPDCHCFGQLHSSPANGLTIVRNVGFAAMAAVVAWQGGRGPVDWFSNLAELSQIVVLLGVSALGLLGALVWITSRLAQQQRELLSLLTADHGMLPVFESDIPSADAFVPHSGPPFDLPSLQGGHLSLQGLISSGKPVLLIFVDPSCGPCRMLVPDIQEWHGRFSSEFNVVLISRGAADVNREKFGDLTVALQEDREIYDLYRVEGTPTAVLVHPTGMVQDSHARGRDQVRDLIARLTRGETGPGSRKNDPAPEARTPHDLLRIPTGPAVGTVGARLPLPDLDGGYVGLDDLRGEETVLLFLSPDCAYSQGMLTDLREWQEIAGEEAGRVLVISDGTDEANRALGLTSRIVIDEGFTTGHDYGVTGTPAAIVLDEQGRVASALAVGADAVLDLLDARLISPAAD